MVNRFPKDADPVYEQSDHLVTATRTQLASTSVFARRDDERFVSQSITGWSITE